MDYTHVVVLVVDGVDGGGVRGCSGHRGAPPRPPSFTITIRLHRPPEKKMEIKRYDHVRFLYFDIEVASGID